MKNIVINFRAVKKSIYSALISHNGNMNVFARVFIFTQV